MLECKAYTLFIAHNARDSSRWLQTVCVDVFVVSFTLILFVFFGFLLRNFGYVMALCLCEKRDITFCGCETKREKNAKLALDSREQMKTNIVFVLTQFSDAEPLNAYSLFSRKVNINFIWIYLFRITHLTIGSKLN